MDPYFEWKIEFVDLDGVGHWVENIKTEAVANHLVEALAPCSMMLDLYRRSVYEWTHV